MIYKEGEQPRVTIKTDNEYGQTFEGVGTAIAVIAPPGQEDTFADRRYSVEINGVVINFRHQDVVLEEAENPTS